jgi:hypothetical protein
MIPESGVEIVEIARGSGISAEFVNHLILS